MRYLGKLLQEKNDLTVLNNMDQSIQRATKHYSSLFTLPSYRKLLLFTFLSCMICGTFVVALPSFFSISGIVLGVQFSILLFILSSTSDIIVRQTVMKLDPIYTLRRCTGLSFFSNLLWLGFLLVGSMLTCYFLSWGFWSYSLLIGYAAVIILRTIALSFTSFRTRLAIILASLIQPIFCFLPMFYVIFSVNTLKVVMFAYIGLFILTSNSVAFVFIYLVNEVSAENLQISIATILRAFLVNWMEDVEGPVETIFEGFGCEKTIKFSLLAFGRKERLKSLVVVSSVHPGPFRNVGSSRFPSMVQKVLEKKHNCVVSVPHGLFSHEFDLSSQSQNHIVLKAIVKSSSFSKFSQKASKFIRVHNDVGSASCQIFGDCALMTLTLAPETTEDFPQEIGDVILEEATKLGISYVTIINAHNSINGSFNVETSLESLKRVGLEALRKASSSNLFPFEVGEAKVVLDEFTCKDGMGPGGICILAFRVNKQTCIYVTVDGNNMVSGLREKILEAIKGLGVNDGEVLTTDTHVVNAIVMNERGYHPVGEIIPHDKLINSISQGVREALTNLEPIHSSCQLGSVPNVRVIGKNQIEEIPHLADLALQRAKGVALPIFLSGGLFLVAVLSLFQL